MITGVNLSDHEVARLLGGRRIRPGQVLAPGPNHSPKDRSMSVFISGGSIRVQSHANDDWKACIDHIRDRLGIPEFSGRSVTAAPPPSSPPPEDEDADRRRSRKFALRIWREAEEPGEGSPVRRYLAKRGLTPREEVFGPVLRYHPSMPFGGTRTGGMVAVCRDIITDERRAIHRTALDAEGNKIEVDGESRMSLGPIGGTAIKLTADEEVTTCLGIGEGIETVLSMRAVPQFGPSPVWALISVSGVASFPVLPGIECLWVAVDRDPAGEKAADEVADRWRRAGREVFLIRPQREKADLNDVVRETAP